ncbi:DUF2793 domain-containing protein [Hyphobacterium sp.]|jgi:hypothetical protein|uniref:DUF2793 domain-containing protein n=1 Tax=Hyphobacterium sp. TaxID=2004662 RepID=UPI003BAC9024
MSTESSPRLGLDYVLAAQAQKHVTVNESLRRLDALVQASVVSRSTDTQPASPAEGDAYILTAQAAGADWDLMADGALAIYRDAEWAEIPSKEGWRIWVEDDQELIVHVGGVWGPLSDSITALGNLHRFGLGTTADASNPFTAKLNAALWTALTAGEGGTGDLRCSLNKESGGHVLSLLFQSAYSSRAEMGLLGDDEFRLKLSPDGAAWQDVIRARPERLDIAAPDGVWVNAVNGTAPAVRRNRILNGDFGIAQRGTSFASAASGDRLLDGWKLASAGGMTCDIAQLSFAPGQGDVPGGPRHYLEWTLTGTAAGYPAIEQRIENVDCLPQGDTVLSFHAMADRSVSLTATFRRHFGSGGSASDVLVQQTLSLSASWARFTVAVPVASLDGKTLGDGHSLALELNLQDGETSVVISLADIQFEPGDTATPFERLSFSENLQRCQRYVASTYAPAIAPGSAVMDGALRSATSGPANTAIFNWRLAVPMRAAPSVTAYSPQTGASGKIDASGTDLAASILSTSTNAIAVQSASHSGVDLAAVHLFATAEL